MLGKLRIISLLSASVLIVCLMGRSVLANDLQVAADTPAITVSTRSGRRNFMRLPALEFAFVIETSCRADLVPQAVSLSIADTRVTVSADELSSDLPLEISVRIPAAQIAPVAVNKFCTNDDTAEGARKNKPVRISSVLSAQASLLCAGEPGSEMIYASASLDVLLHCEIDESANPGAITLR
jgi:hypothetical protein